MTRRTLIVPMFFAALLLVGFTSVAAAAPQTLRQPASAAPAFGSRTSMGPGLAATPKPFTCAEGKCIECAGSGDNAHKSTHEPTTINVIVKVTCTEPVTSIWLRAGLYHYVEGKWVLNCCSAAKTALGSSEASQNYAVPCQTGWWVGYIEFEVIFPNESSGGSKGAVGKQVYIEKC